MNVSSGCYADSFNSSSSRCVRLDRPFSPQQLPTKNIVLRRCKPIVPFAGAFAANELIKATNACPFVIFAAAALANEPTALAFAAAALANGLADLTSAAAALANEPTALANEPTALAFAATALTNEPTALAFAATTLTNGPTALAFTTTVSAIAYLDRAFG